MRLSRAARRTIALMAGALIDARLGDPPNRWHPVAWVGRFVGVLEMQAPRRPVARAAFGAVVVFSALPLVAADAWLSVRLASRLPGGDVAASALILALATSQRTLYRRAIEVAAALERGDLETARRLAATHLVSRDTSTLDATGVAAATIESVAENLSDGVIAPWWWFAVAGAPGAWAYRVANTLDAMWGYRSEPYADLGRAAARLDDVLNLVPARLSAAALLAAGGGAGLLTWWRDHGHTASPNAGHPMAAMGGVLGVALAKEGHYVLGEGQRNPGPEDIRRAVALARRAATMTLAVLAVGALWWGRR